MISTLCADLIFHLIYGIDLINLSVSFDVPFQFDHKLPHFIGLVLNVISPSQWYGHFTHTCLIKVNYILLSFNFDLRHIPLNHVWRSQDPWVLLLYHEQDEITLVISKLSPGNQKCFRSLPCADFSGGKSKSQLHSKSNVSKISDKVHVLLV